MNKENKRKNFTMDTKGNKINKTCEQILGTDLSEIYLKMQSALIKSGIQLENIIENECKQQNILIDDFNKFVNLYFNKNVPPGEYLLAKSVLKKSFFYIKKNEPDFILFHIYNDSNKLDDCIVYELKSGSNFSTKTVESENKRLISFTTIFDKILNYNFNVKYQICSFYNQKKDVIQKNFRYAVNIENIITGKEFCKTLNISYKNIILQQEEIKAQNQIEIKNKIKEILLYT